MGFPDNSIKHFKIGEKQIVIGNSNNDIELDNLHVVEEFNLFTDTYDKNFDFKILTKSYSSVFMNDINELIGNDNEITDAEIETYIEKKKGFYTVDDVKKVLVDLFSAKKSDNFQKTKNADGEIVNDKIRTIKIGDKKIYLGDEITGAIDISRYCTKGYCDNNFLYQFVNKDTNKIDNEIEAKELYKLVESLSDENNEITDNAIKEYIAQNPNLRGYKPAWIKEFLIQAFPEPKTEEEKQRYFAANEARIQKITDAVNLMHSTSNDKLVMIGKDIVQEFRKEFGSPESPSMRMIIEKEYYQKDSAQNDALHNVRYGGKSNLAENVKKYNVANCQEDAELTQQLIQKKYPEMKSFQIEFAAQNNLSDTVHVAVLVFPEEMEQKFEPDTEKYNKDSSFEKYRGCYVIDNWFGGVYRAEDWIKMQKVLHKVDDIEINTN